MSADSPRSRAVKWHRSELGCSGPLALPMGLAPQSWGNWGPWGQRASLWVWVAAPGMPSWSCWGRTQGHGEGGCLQCPGWGLRVGPPLQGLRVGPPTLRGLRVDPRPSCAQSGPPMPRGFRVDPHPHVLSVGPPTLWTQWGPPPRVGAGPGHGGQQPHGQRGAAPACSVSVSLYPAG